MTVTGLTSTRALRHSGPEATKGNPQERVRGPEWNSSSLGPLENDKLMPEMQDLNLQRGSCPKDRGQSAE